MPTHAAIERSDFEELVSPRPQTRKMVPMKTPTIKITMTRTKTALPRMKRIMARHPPLARAVSR